MSYWAVDLDDELGNCVREVWPELRQALQGIWDGDLKGARILCEDRASYALFCESPGARESGATVLVPEQVFEEIRTSPGDGCVPRCCRVCDCDALAESILEENWRLLSDDARGPLLFCLHQEATASQEAMTGRLSSIMSAQKINLLLERVSDHPVISAAWRIANEKQQPMFSLDLWRPITLGPVDETGITQAFGTWLCEQVVARLRSPSRPPRDHRGPTTNLTEEEAWYAPERSLPAQARQGSLDNRVDQLARLIAEKKFVIVCGYGTGVDYLCRKALELLAVQNKGVSALEQYAAPHGMETIVKNMGSRFSLFGKALLLRNLLDYKVATWGHDQLAPKWVSNVLPAASEIADGLERFLKDDGLARLRANVMEASDAYVCITSQYDGPEWWRTNLEAFGAGRMSQRQSREPASVVPPFVEACEKDGLVLSLGSRCPIDTIKTREVEGLLRRIIADWTVENQGDGPPEWSSDDKLVKDIATKSRIGGHLRPALAVRMAQYVLERRTPAADFAEVVEPLGEIYREAHGAQHRSVREI